MAEDALFCLPQKLVDQHTGKNADEYSDDGETKQSAKTAIKYAMYDFAIGCSGKYKSHRG